MPSEKGIVHVIDDDEAMRESLAFLLGAVGMDVQTYGSATAFLDVATEVKAGCVITDVRMPELSGVELLRRKHVREDVGRREAERRPHRFGGLRGDGGITAVGVGADRLAKLLVERSATDHDDVVVPDVLLLQGFDDHLHVGHGGGEKS